MSSQVCLLCSQLALQQGNKLPSKFFCDPRNHPQVCSWYLSIANMSKVCDHDQFAVAFPVRRVSRQVKYTTVTGLYFKGFSPVPQFVSPKPSGPRHLNIRLEPTPASIPPILREVEDRTTRLVDGYQDASSADFRLFLASLSDRCGGQRRLSSVRATCQTRTRIPRRMSPPYDCS
ncbi:hypothetical protein HGRIS_010794 [Hohenbuehelia grisea]|uniref:Uncharacterized protein n=1 Tax=Hohenbuehelia grisea TaxID=104357 RepID=A0ABR3IY06_9AGAR